MWGSRYRKDRDHIRLCSAGRPKTLICQIDDFSPLPKEFSEQKFYKFILSEISNRFFSEIAKNTIRSRLLSDDEKILLTYYYLNFASDATRGLAQRTARRIQVSPVRRLFFWFYDVIRNPLNVVANAGATLIADIVAKAIGVNSITAKVTEYFPEIVAGVETDLPEAEATLEALRRFSELVRKAGFTRIVLIIDKIDEDPRFDNAAEEIADFIEPILKNNKFLLDESLQVVISLWIVPLNFLKDKVRTQKIFSPEIRWEYEDLRRAYDRRVEVFSDGAAARFNMAFSKDVTDDQKNRILELSNRNPRDLWHLMDKIYKAQYKIDAAQCELSNQAIERGMSDFVRQFNFYEYYPRKANARANSMDVYSYVRHLLRLEAPNFTRNQLNDRAKTGSSTQNYTVGMESLGLIEKDVSDKGEISYFIRDPKVRFALANGIEISKN